MVVVEREKDLLSLDDDDQTPRSRSGEPVTRRAEAKRRRRVAP
jgi:hypothetical protein